MAVYFWSSSSWVFGGGNFDPAVIFLFGSLFFGRLFDFLLGFGFFLLFVGYFFLFAFFFSYVMGLVFFSVVGFCMFRGMGLGFFGCMVGISGVFRSVMGFCMFRGMVFGIFFGMGLVGFFLSSFVVGFFVLRFFVIIEFGDDFTLLFGLFVGFGFRFSFGFQLRFSLWLGFSFRFLLGGGFFGRLLGFLSFRFFGFGLSRSVVALGFGSSELSGHVSDSSPILDSLSLLSAHFDEKPPVEDFFIVVVSDEIDSIDSHFEHNFKRSRVVIFDFDQIEFRESFSDIVFSGVEIAFDQVEGDVLNFLIKVFD